MRVALYRLSIIKVHLFQVTLQQKLLTGMTPNFLYKLMKPREGKITSRGRFLVCMVSKQKISFITSFLKQHILQFFPYSYCLKIILRLTEHVLLVNLVTN